MRRHVHLAHDLVRRLHLDRPLTKLAGACPVLCRAIPLHRDYQGTPCIRARRGGALFELDRSDYMQWHLYAQLQDAAVPLARRHVADEAVIFDIGANVGAFSLKLAQLLKRDAPRSRIHAFEPNPAAVGLLQRNVHLNPDLAPLIEIHQVALGDAPGRLEFHVNAGNSGGSSLLNPGDDIGGQRLDVEIDTVDAFVRQRQLARVDYLKIDVEGYEPKVLLGAVETIRRFRPLIYLEMTHVWFQRIGWTNTMVTELLTNSGYECYRVEHGGSSVARLATADVDGLPQFDLLARPRLPEQ